MRVISCLLVSIAVSAAASRAADSAVPPRIAAAKKAAASMPTGPALEARDVPGIIPAPAAMAPKEGSFALGPDVPIIYDDAAAKTVAERLAMELNRRAGLDCPVRCGADAPDSTRGVRLRNGEAPVRAAELPDEGYELTIAPSGVSVKARSPAGLFYGVQSLLQLVEAQRPVKGKPVSLPAVEIADQPRFAWRGVMLDESRHFFGKDTVEQLLDVMAWLKLNRFHWHLTDEPGWRIEIKKYPKLTEVGARGNWSDPAAPRAFYTQEEIREVIAYAAARQIEIVPEIDMPGHATAACRAYPELSGGGTGFTFNPGKEATYRFLEDVLAEVAALFPSSYIHLGGDEVNFGNKAWNTDPTIVKFTRDHGLKNAAELEHYFMRRMVAVTKRLGKRPMGWDDVAAGVAPGEAALFWWHHERPQILTQSLERGYSVVLCPRHPCYFDFVQHDSHKEGRRWNGYNDLLRVYGFPEPALAGLIPAGKEANLLGIEACLWTERVQDRGRLEFMLFPRLAATAETAWTPAAAKDKGRFLERIPGFLRELDRRKLRYFNPLHPEMSPEPAGPKKKAGGTAEG